MHKLLYSGCMIENVLMSGFIWFSSLSPIEVGNKKLDFFTRLKGDFR